MKYCLYIVIEENSQSEIHSESYKINPNLDSNYTFPIDLAREEILFGAESIRGV